MVNMKEFGEHIARLRDDAGYGSQDEAGRKIGVSRQTVNRWEQGKAIPSLENINVMADVYGVTAHSLAVMAGVDIPNDQFDADIAAYMMRQEQKLPASKRAIFREGMKKSADLMVSMLVAA